MRPEQTKLLAEASKLRRDIKLHIEMAEKAEIVTEAITGPLWTKIIRPYIEVTLTSFQASVYSLPVDEFVKHQGVANGLNALLNYIEGLVGTRQEHLDAAEKIKQKLEQAEREGLIPRSEEE